MACYGAGATHVSLLGRSPSAASWDAGPVSNPPGPVGYSERLHLPVLWWLLGVVFVAAVGWAFFVATPLPVTVVAILVTAALVTTWLVRHGAVRILVDGESLRAGRAVLPRVHVGAVAALDAEMTRRTLGREADARAFLVTRAYCTTAVRVEVADKTDPTPYWVISTRHPQRLAACLNSAGMPD